MESSLFLHMGEPIARRCISSTLVSHRNPFSADMMFKVADKENSFGFPLFDGAVVKEIYFGDLLVIKNKLKYEFTASDVMINI